MIISLFVIALQLCVSIKLRNFIKLPLSRGRSLSRKLNTVNFRVLQFNVLADGLSGQRSDLGSFSRVSKYVLNWERRKNLLLQEITQYSPDVVTL